MEEDLLSRVIKDTMGSNTENKPYLNPEQEKSLLSRIDYEPGKTLVYRQFIPMRDAIEYTVYYVTKGKKKRVDFQLEIEDFKDDGDLERQAVVVAKAVIYSHEMRDRWEQ